MIVAMNHFTVLSSDLGRTLDFYVGLLGLRTGPRPDFPFPGAWLNTGGAPILHVVAGRRVPNPASGVIDHMAFSASGLADTRARLDARGLAYTLRQLPGGSGWQLFCFDPDGARVELDFDAAETS